MEFAVLAERIVERRRPGDRCLVIGVDGWSGAGKTGFARRLASQLSAACISTDELVPGWDGLRASLDLVAGGILAPATRGEPGRWRRFDWVAQRPAEWVEVPTAEVLVVEGCCAGVPPIVGYLSYLIWLEAPDAERRRRLQAREDWEAYSPFFDRWRAQEVALQSGAGTPARADLVVDNSEVRHADPWGDRLVVDDRPPARTGVD